MPKLFLTLLLFATALIAGAQSYSRLSISTTGEQYLKFRFAGKQYSPESHATTFQNLTPGSYPLTIYQWNEAQKKWVEVFNKNITLNGGKHLDVVIMRFGYNAWNEGDIRSDDWSTAVNNPVPDGTVPGAGNSTGYTTATDAQFNAIKTAVANSWSDADKLSTAKAVVKNYMFTLAQVRSIAELFSSDANKLAFMQHAYRACGDKGLYFSLADIFWSNSYKKQLMDFIAAQ